MENTLFCEYRFKNYLNASHYILINGIKGQVHPHTWEFTLDILVPRTEFMEFSIFEKEIEKYFEKFQNRTMNDVPPYDTQIPTLETMTENFGVDLREIIRKAGGELMKIEGSETPTRSYIIGFTSDSEYLTSINRKTEKSLDNIVDRVLDSIL